MKAVHEHSEQETFIHPTVEDRNPGLSWMMASVAGVDAAALLCGCDLQRQDLISASCDTEAVTAGILFFPAQLFVLFFIDGALRLTLVIN